MIIDSFLEWLVIAVGIVLALFVIAPQIPNFIGEKIKKNIPHPSAVNDWLNRWGL